jgi:hypothetical protein
MHVDDLISTRRFSCDNGRVFFILLRVDSKKCAGQWRVQGCIPTGYESVSMVTIARPKSVIRAWPTPSARIFGWIRVNAVA